MLSGRWETDDIFVRLQIQNIRNPEQLFKIGKLLSRAYGLCLIEFEPLQFGEAPFSDGLYLERLERSDVSQTQEG